MNHHLSTLQEKIAPLRTNITHHPLYSSIRSIEDVRVFMRYHVYAVWDFMSLLKSLQRNLTCVSTPWFPVGHADTRFLINEIVTGEESDVDQDGIRKSHFELYIDAMKQCGADLAEMETFTRSLRETGDLDTAFEKAGTPAAARDFIRFTFDTIGQRDTASQAAVFTFGREDLIPGMFMAMVADLNQEAPERISIFKYYLERHIEVDGDHHSHLAMEMTSHLCGDDEAKWSAATQATEQSLRMRLSLWDAAYREINERSH